MQLSIVIVNYNVKHFLEQCLLSVEKAIHQIDSEVFVVDNSSVDESCQMIREKFPWVKLIESKQNLGFSKGNNLALRKTNGKYILLLNPDTIVETDTFSKCIDFMESHDETGALGVKMIDGKGNFLPESKRALPTPIVSFYKIFGLTSLFPKSKIFARYYLGHLDKDKTNEIEILPGAFMFMRKSTLDKVGFLDEQFFMYGEDIDLSYRITKSGYKIHYYPETRIIHYKGESTKKGSLNYVMVFYQAMLIFAKKHFSKQNIALFNFFIKIAIYFRASVSATKRLIENISLPLAEITLSYAGITIFRHFWEQFHLQGNSYPVLFSTIVLPCYLLVWSVSTFLHGGYEKPFKLLRNIKASLYATIFILAIYALLPLEYRFSRITILVGAGIYLLITLLIRVSLFLIDRKKFGLWHNFTKRLLIISGNNEYDRINEILHSSLNNYTIIQHIQAHPDNINNETLRETVRIHKINELVFSGKDLSSNQIIDIMVGLGDLNVDFKILPPESIYIIGSNSVNSSGELYNIGDSFTLSSANLRNKFIFDVFISTVTILCSPVLLFFKGKNTFFLIKSSIQCIFRSKTWIGIHPKIQSISTNSILKKSIFNSQSNLHGITHDEREIKESYRYLKTYDQINDLKIFVKAIKKL